MNERERAGVRGKKAYLASADAQGVPHLAVGEVEEFQGSRLQVSGWLCPFTLRNLGQNPHLLVVVGLGEEGYQFVGRVVEKAVDAYMDGYAAGDEEVPHARYRLSVEVDRTIAMTERPHSDRDLE
jgi:hypothetical protein